MNVKMPFMSKSAKMEPLQRCLTHAAKNMGVNEFFVATLMSHFLEQIAEEVSQGHSVNIPGFGIFYPYAYHPKWDTAPPPFCVPSFAPSAAYRAQCKAECPLEAGWTHAQRSKTRSNMTASRERMKNRRVGRAMTQIRQTAVKQARKLGLDGGPRDDMGVGGEILP
jgi:hypothetical protein